MRNVYGWGHRRKNSLGDPHGFSGVLPPGVMGPSFVFLVELAGAGMRRHGFGHRCSASQARKSEQTMASQLPALVFPWRGPLPEPCDAYLGSADLWNEVIQEVESL